jgi:hypothetical protein
MLLGDKDFTPILMKEVSFQNENHILDTLIDGFISLDICREGGDRLLGSFGVMPGIFVEISPTNNTLLKIKCYCIERGEYFLSVVDLTGSSTIVHK